MSRLWKVWAGVVMGSVWLWSQSGGVSSIPPNGGGPGGSSALIVQEESVDLPVQPKLNFLGTDFDCVDNPGATSTDCTHTTPVSGVSAFGDMLDCKVVRTNSTTLTIGACRVYYPNKTPFTLANSSTIVWDSGDGDVRIWVDSAGHIQIGLGPGLNVTCTGGVGVTCTEYAGNPVVAYPDNVAKVWTWSANGGVWLNTTSDYVDERNMGIAGGEDIEEGAGILASVNPVTGKQIIEIDTDVVETVLSHQNGTNLKCNSTSAANTYTCDLAVTLLAYAESQVFNLCVDNANTGASTVNINGLGAKNIYVGQSGTTNPTANQIAGCTLINYDGTQFRIGGGGTSLTAGVNIDITANVISTKPGLGQLSIVDDFVAGSATTTGGNINSVYMWETTCASGSVAVGDTAQTNHDGIILLTTQAAGSASCVIIMRRSSTQRPLWNLVSSSWEAEWILKPTAVSANNFYVGFVNGANRIQVYSNAGGNFTAEWCTASCGTTGASMGVAPSADTWYHIRMVSNGSTVTATVNGANSTVLTGSSPSTSLAWSPIFSTTVASGSTAQILTGDAFSFFRTFGTRY